MNTGKPGIDPKTRPRRERPWRVQGIRFWETRRLEPGYHAARLPELGFPPSVTRAGLEPARFRVWWRVKSWPARWLRPGQKEKGLDIYYLGSICCSVAMGKKKIHRLGDLQLRIMKILWERGEASVAEVLEGLGREASLAYTTVATMLRKMETRGLVAHRVSGRSFIYRSQVQAGEVSRSMADHFVDRLFEGSLLEAVNHLLNTREVSREELVKLERLITEKKKCT